MAWSAGGFAGWLVEACVIDFKVSFKDAIDENVGVDPVDLHEYLLACESVTYTDL